MVTPAYITETYTEAQIFGLAKLSSREHAFLQSIFDASQRVGFNGLSEKQSAWLNAIAAKLNATKGKDMVTVIAERSAHRIQRYRSAYYAAAW